MRELLVTLFIVAATYTLWRVVRPRRNNAQPSAVPQPLQVLDAAPLPMAAARCLGP